MLYLNDASCFIPPTYLDVEEAGALLNLEKAHIRVYKKFYGIEKIPAAKQIPLVDFVRRPVELLLQKNNLQNQDIHYLIHCHTAKVITPFGESIVRRVKQELKLENAIAFGVSLNNCASTLATLDMLTHVLSHDEKAIIVSADYAFTSVLQLIPNTSILGDAAGAVLVSKKGQCHKLMAISLKIEGRYAKGIWLSAEEAQEFETHYVELLSSTIVAAITKANLSLEQIKLIIPHNVNIPSWKRVSSYLQISLDKIYLKNIRKYSHCFGADIFINYISALQEKQLEPGDYYMMATVGLGVTCAAAVFQY